MKRTISLAMFALLFIGMLTAPIVNVSGTTGVEGNISAGVSSVFLNTVVGIKCYNMDAAADYSLEVNDVATQNWTNGAAQTEKTFFMTFESSQVADGQIKVGLGNASKGPELDVIYLTVTEVGDIIDTDFAFDLFTPFLILGILISILGAILGGGIIAVKRMT